MNIWLLSLLIKNKQHFSVAARQLKNTQKYADYKGGKCTPRPIPPPIKSKTISKLLSICLTEQTIYNKRRKIIIPKSQATVNMYKKIYIYKKEDSYILKRRNTKRKSQTSNKLAGTKLEAEENAHHPAGVALYYYVSSCSYSPSR